MDEITVIIGSESDRSQILPLMEQLTELNINHSIHVYSAHRNLKELIKFLENNETKVYIALAGLSAALPGVVASLVKEPVIGVPLVSGELNGLDALLSILQLPKGIPVATMGIGKQGQINAVLFACRIMGKM